MNRSLFRLIGIVGAAMSATALFLLATAWASMAANATADTQGANPAPTNGNFDSLNATVAITADCRYGVLGSDSSYLNWLVSQNIGIGWNSNFTTNPNGGTIPGGEYVNLIRVRQDKDAGGNYLSTYQVTPPLNDGGLGAAIASQHGALWQIGNEPDRGPNVPTDTNRVQDDTLPQMYAQIYHDVYQYIKTHDPTAQVAPAGLVEVTPGRLQYWDLVWNAYQSLYGTSMPADVWNSHIYPLPEALHDGSAPNEVASVAKGTDLSIALKEGTYIVGDTQWCNNIAYLCTAAHDDIGYLNQWNFSRQIVGLRTWMKNHGLQDKPLIITEFGTLYECTFCNNLVNPTTCFPRDEYGNCFTPGRSAAFLTASFNYLYGAMDPNIGDRLDNNRLVQQWLWFSSHDPGFVNPNLVTPTVPMTFTVVGNALKAEALSRPQDINLFARSTFPQSQFTAGGLTTVTVGVDIMNNGSIAPSRWVTVTAYADPGHTQVLGSGLLTSAPGCARRDSIAYVSWSVPANTNGNITYYIRVDPGNVIGETTMADNDITGSLRVFPDHLFLPIIER